jgi:AcrR family transcriptional regulator
MRFIMRVKTDERRQTILDISKEIFSVQGFDGTSMLEISNRLGGSRATLYNYFRTKGELFIAVMEMSADEFLRSAFAIPNQNIGIREGLVNIGFNYLNSVLTPDVMAVYRLTMSESSRSDIGRDVYENSTKKGWLIISQYMKFQMENIQIIQDDPWECALFFKGLVESQIVEPYFLGICSRPDSQKLKNIVDKAVTVFLRAYSVKNEV